MSSVTFLRRLALTGLAAAALASAAVPAAHASVSPMGAHWIMNDTQWQTLQAAGYTGPAPQFLLCSPDGTGPDTADSTPPPRSVPCTAGMTPAFANYFTLDSYLKASKGAEPAAVDYDPEGWTFTPHNQAVAEGYYDRLAAAAAKTYGVKLIASPVAPSGQQDKIEADAARDGAWAVELQIQYATGSPAKYQALVEASVAAIRAKSKTVVIIGGIASDAGGYATTARLMWASWSRTRHLVAGYWLNAAPWAVHANGSPATGCAPGGCIQVAENFLTEAAG